MSSDQSLANNSTRAFVDEIQKVTWPTRSETIRLTLIVVGVSIFVGIYVGVIDIGLAQALRMITK